MSKSERVDEIAPLIAGAARVAGSVASTAARVGGGAVRAASSALKSYARKKAMEKAKEKAKEKLIGKRNDPQVDQALEQEMEMEEACWAGYEKNESIHNAYFNLAAALLEGISTGDSSTATGKRVGAALAGLEGKLSPEEFKRKKEQSARIGRRTAKRQQALAAQMGVTGSEGKDVYVGKRKGFQQARAEGYEAKKRKIAAADAEKIIQMDADRQATRNPIATGDPNRPKKRGSDRPKSGSPEETETIAKRTAGTENSATRRIERARRRAEREEETARAAARGTYRRGIEYSKSKGKLNPKTGSVEFDKEKESRTGAFIRGTKENIVDKTPGAVARTLASPFKIAAKQAVGAATGIANTRKSINKGRASMRARRQRIDFSTEYQRIGSILAEASAAWTRKEGKNPSGGLNAKGVASYRAKNPGSKLKTAVTTKPSKLKKGSKAANRRKSFCARMKGMRSRQKSSNNTGKDRLSLSLKKWNC